jgi:hypothetical protein
MSSIDDHLVDRVVGKEDEEPKIRDIMKDTCQHMRRAERLSYAVIWRVINERPELSDAGHWFPDSPAVQKTP